MGWPITDPTLFALLEIVGLACIFAGGAVAIVLAAAESLYELDDTEGSR